MTDEYLTIAAPSQGLYREKGSRFIAFAHPVVAENDIKQILHELKRKYHDARHICYAFRLGAAGDVHRAVDDGEPSGTAGKPILGQLLSNNITNVAVFVVRYFGGVKLGVSGLINAYRAATADALANTEIIAAEDCARFTVLFDYAQINSVMQTLKDEQASIETQNFDLNCSIQLHIRKSKAETLKNKLKNKGLMVFD
ncbi:MAG: YigZ family protein [Prevotellaceae bacterium]|jgi:uncharacterized YigZ family protein|nr:YigZ family protein [Prevotellaceae bacterium]